MPIRDPVRCMPIRSRSHTRRRHRIAALVIGWAACGAAWADGGAAEDGLLALSGGLRPVKAPSIVPTGGVVGIVRLGGDARAEVDRPLPLGRSNLRRAAPGRDLLRLTDGQVLVGEFVTPGARAGAPPADAVAFRPTGLPALSISLDRVAMLVLAPEGSDGGERAEAARAAVSGPGLHPMTDAEPAIDDRVVLRNGDVRTGFVVELGERVLLDTEAGEFDLPLSVVSSVSLANDPAPPPAGTVWLDDGTVLEADLTVAPAGEGASMEGTGPVRIEPRHDAAEATPSDHAGAWPVAILPAMRVLAAADGLVPLAGIEPLERYALADRGFLGTRVAMEAGGSISWSLPAGARAFAADVLLSTPLPIATGHEILWDAASGTRGRPDAGPQEAAERTLLHDRLGPGAYSACVVRFELLDGRGVPRTVLASADLSGERPAARVRARFPEDAQAGWRLRIRIDEGAKGPVQDRVLIDGAVLSVDGGDATD